MNLCTNAAQAMKDAGGNPEVSLTNTEIEAADIKQHPELDRYRTFADGRRHGPRH